MTNLLFDRHEDLVLFAKAQIRPPTEVGQKGYSPFEQFLLGHRSFSHCAMDYIQDLQSLRTVQEGEVVLSEDQQEVVGDLVKVVEILRTAEEAALRKQKESGGGDRSGFIVSLELFKEVDLEDLVDEGKKLK